MILGYESFSDDRVIDAHIKNIRHKLSEVGASAVIKTVYGVGYKYDEH